MLVYPDHHLATLMRGKFMQYSKAAFILAATLLVFFATIPDANAGSIVDHATKAEALLESGKSVEAISELDAAMEVIWSASPLVFRKVLFVKQSTGYGLYVERGNQTFKPDEPLLIYVEPIGYGYGDDGTGGNEISLAVDFVLTDGNGKELFSKDDFITLGTPLRYHNREFHLDLSINLTGMPEGSYVGKYHIRDLHSDKSGDFELPFEVAG
jgi:hypothetical protein